MEKLLETREGNVQYWITKVIDPKKTTIFFLHGLTASHALFVNQIGFFATDYNVIVWDAPAHGTSRPFTEFTYEKAALAAVSILKDNGIEKAVFVGQSMGGFITQAVIKRHPEVVQGFISIDSTPYGEKYYSKSDKWWLRQVEWMAMLYPNPLLKRGIAKQCTRTKEAYDNMKRMLSSYNKKELCHLMGIGYAGFLEDNCDIKINCPVMLMVGEHDRTGKVRHYNKEWAKDLNVPVVWITNAAHNANDDNPGQVNSHIVRFLNNLSA